MPITTQTIAKGIPPRLHQPKPSHKAKKGKSNTRATIKSSCKRVAISDSDEESESEPIRKKDAKSHHLEVQEESEEEEVVSEHMSEPPEITDVDNGVATSPSSDAQDVRT
jgi:hypothetical protein